MDSVRILQLLLLLKGSWAAQRYSKESLLKVVWWYLQEVNYTSGFVGLKSRDKKPSGRFSLLIIIS